MTEAERDLARKLYHEKGKEPSEIADIFYPRGGKQRGALSCPGGRRASCSRERDAPPRRGGHGRAEAAQPPRIPGAQAPRLPGAQAPRVPGSQDRRAQAFKADAEESQWQIHL